MSANKDLFKVSYHHNTTSSFVYDSINDTIYGNLNRQKSISTSVIIDFIKYNSSNRLICFSDNNNWIIHNISTQIPVDNYDYQIIVGNHVVSYGNITLLSPILPTGSYVHNGLDFSNPINSGYVSLIYSFS